RAENRGTHWLGGPDLLVEVQSPGDESEAKAPFYSRIGVRELLIVHRDMRQLRLFRHDSTDLTPVEPSDFRGKKWLRSALAPLALRRTTLKGEGPRAEVGHTDDTPGQWLICPECFVTDRLSPRPPPGAADAQNPVCPAVPAPHQPPPHRPAGRHA